MCYTVMDCINMTKHAFPSSSILRCGNVFLNRFDLLSKISLKFLLIYRAPNCTLPMMSLSGNRLFRFCLHGFRVAVVGDINPDFWAQN